MLCGLAHRWRSPFSEPRRRAVYLQYADYKASPHASYIVLDQQLGQEQFGEPAKFFQIGVRTTSRSGSMTWTISSPARP